MKTILTFLVLCFLTNPMDAQNTLKGTVQNEQGTPLSNARVYLMVKACTGSLSMDNKTDKKTDVNGSFEMSYVKSEEPVLYVEAVGYERKKVKITDDFIIVKLNPLNNSVVKKGQRTDEITVRGVCGMCKKRIEEAVFAIKGVSSADWNAEKQALFVSYDPAKTDNETIQRRIANVGHDTQLLKADSKIYDKLPRCCHYRDGIKLH